MLPVIGIGVERIDGVPVVRPQGDIDAANAQEVHDELASQITADTSAIVIDLTAARYVDSAGIDMLFRLHDRLRQRRSKLLLVIPAASQLNRLVEIVGLDKVVPVHHTVEDALGAWRGR
jgi:anti-sigma B factor antagonist